MEILRRSVAVRSMPVRGGSVTSSMAANELHLSYKRQTTTRWALAYAGQRGARTSSSLPLVIFKRLLGRYDDGTSRAPSNSH